MVGELVLAFFLFRYLRKNLSEPLLEKWDKLLLRGMYALPVLFVLDVVVIKDSISKWIGYLILLALAYIVYAVGQLRNVKNFVVAILPFIAISFFEDIIKLISPTIHNKIDIYFGVITTCSIIWMVAMLVINGKQQKALKKEREKTEKEEEQNRIMAIKKEELEKMVNERTSELVRQKEELQHALVELRETQSQLIQKEKMASLGELTAGIAHEIQNPLNFVNNFSELNGELISELYHEIDKGNYKEVKSIANDIKENEKKINHHGKRADSIVKGMLQHSRSSASGKEPTDINALADEYFRLSYHGLRAKDKTFNATMETDFDKDIKLMNIIPEDIGRVFLNLLSNAFYSVTEKKKNCIVLKGSDEYEPKVSVSTKRIGSSLGNMVSIKIKDNGIGIPKEMLDKIFQPFFTTKPTGQGTGLGLSLSYDIIKAHGGELKVNTKEGDFAEFVIELPTD